MTKHEFTKEFSDVLSMHMKNNNLSYTNMCKMSHINKSVLIGYLNGTTLVSVPVIIRLCSDLGVNPTTIDILVRHRETLESDRATISRYDFQTRFIEDVEDGMDFCNTDLKQLSEYLHIRLDRLIEYMTRQATPSKKIISRIYKALDYEQYEIDEILELRDRVK